MLSLLGGRKQGHSPEEESIMTEQETLNRIKQGYDYFASGNIAALVDELADDVEWITPDLESVPFSGTCHGKGEVANYFKLLGDAIQITRFEVRDIIAGEDKAAATGLLVGDVATTGKTLEMDWMHLLQYDRNGKLKRCQQFFDTAAMKAAFTPLEVEKSILQASQPLH